MPNKLRAIVVGTGHWAEAHLTAYRQCKNITVVGLWGHQNEEKLRKLAKKFEIQDVSLSLDDLLNRTTPDVVDIVCNPNFRLEGVQACMRPEIKLINLEKPLALTPKDAYEIADLCHRNNKLLLVNHQKKFLPAWAHAKRFISEGSIGEIRLIRATCKGNILEQGTHLLDVALFLNDYSRPSWIMGQVADFEGFDKPASSAPDSAIAEVAFENGVRASFTFGNAGHEVPGETFKWHHFACEIYGTKGHIQISLNKTLKLIQYDRLEVHEEESNSKRDHTAALADHLDAGACYAVEPSKGHISDLEHSLISFDLVMAIYESAYSNQKVSFPFRAQDDLIQKLRQRQPANEEKLQTI
jgi:predicted dehydrogenase